MSILLSYKSRFKNKICVNENNKFGSERILYIEFANNSELVNKIILIYITTNNVIGIEVANKLVEIYLDNS